MVEWRKSEGLTDYDAALDEMQARAADIRAGTAGECVWLLEHSPLYTAGTSAKGADLLDPRFPVYEAGRGGEYTYHGPGQRIAYVMLDLETRGRDIKKFVCDLEDWLIRVAAEFGVKGERREGRIGVWVDLATYGRPGQEAKLAAIGVRLRKWVSYHGIAFNLAPDLSHYTGIVPCGIRDAGVTSLRDLGVETDMQTLDAALKLHWEAVF